MSTGLAGEILQKYVNYGGRIAIYGDYSRHTSKQLKDFIYESNASTFPMNNSWVPDNCVIGGVPAKKMKDIENDI